MIPLAGALAGKNLGVALTDRYYHGRNWLEAVAHANTWPFEPPLAMAERLERLR